MHLSYGSRTDVGAWRELNEDAVLTMAPVFAIADGMGGHAAGEVAATLAVEQMSALAGRQAVHADDVLAAIEAANAAIVKREKQSRETAGMGTTLAGVCLGEVAGSPHWLIFNVGDSRVYHFVHGRLRQVTVDHSEVAELVAAGRITADEALDHPMRNVVTRSLGTVPAPSADIWLLPVADRERFLICSDGLTGEISDAEIASLIGSAAPAQAVADDLVSRAVAAGGRDNVSVVVVDVVGDEQPACADDTTPRRRLGSLE